MGAERERTFGDTLDWLGGWLARHADGEWEHAHGVRIEWLGEPGWRVELDLGGTELERAAFEDVDEADGRGYRLRVWRQDAPPAIQATCSAEALSEVVAVLRGWAWRHAGEPEPLRLPHACETMRASIDDPRVQLSYAPRVREYRVPIADSAAAQALAFCPFCGDALPPSLREPFFAAADELGLDPFVDAMPAPYDSDAWWWDDPRFREPG